MNPRADAEGRARARDRQIQASLDELTVPAPRHLLTQIRAYLLEMRDRGGHPGNRVEAALKSETSKGRVLINLGPTIDRGPEEDHFYFTSGARLSFGISVKPEGSKGRLVSYRFDYRLSEPAPLPMIRFELRDSPHEKPLSEPLAHFHPGIENFRLPTGLVDPFEVLDLLFFVIEPSVTL